MKKISSGCESCDTTSLVTGGSLTNQSAPSSSNGAGGKILGASSTAGSRVTNTALEVSRAPGIFSASPGARRKRISIKLDRTPLTHHEFLSSYSYQEKEPISESLPWKYRI
jgi:hypothetical protein